MANSIAPHASTLAGITNGSGHSDSPAGTASGTASELSSTRFSRHTQPTGWSWQARWKRCTLTERGETSHVSICDAEKLLLRLSQNHYQSLNIVTSWIWFLKSSWLFTRRKWCFMEQSQSNHLERRSHFIFTQVQIKTGICFNLFRCQIKWHLKNVDQLTQ